MNANDTIFGSIFFRRCVSVYALCAMLALPAVGQDAGNLEKPAAPAKTDDSKDVKVSEYGTVDISVQETDLATVLQMLSIESKKNIITGKGVQATVTANLYGVTFYEALKGILDVNGYTYYEEGNFIYVITKEESDAMAKARRKTESRIFPLNYLSALDANEFIQPLLSAEGKAAARGTVTAGMKPEVSNNGADDYAFSPRLVVNDYADNLEAMNTLITSLDTPPQQVLVEAVIIQTAMNEDNAFGIDFTVLGSLDFTNLTNPLAAVNNLLAGNDATKGFRPPDNNAQAGTTNVGNTSAPGGLKIGVISDDIAVFLRVLDEVTDTFVLARPKVMALNRQRAEVHVGTKVGFLSTTSTETTTTQNVQFLDTGVQLVFRPFISTDGMIRLELKPSVSDFRLRDVTDSTGNSVTIPDELTNQIITNVRVKDGQTLVLGGLFKDSTQTTRRQVPLLGDIPVVGTVFRGQDDTVKRSEIIFLITPTIIHDSALWAMGQEQLGAADVLRVGARSELLPFSRERVTANYNEKAQAAFNQGDQKKALYYINNSLGLSPNQPEMISLRAKITGEYTRSHERSLMERTLRKNLGMPEEMPHVSEAAPSNNEPAIANSNVESPTQAASTEASNENSEPQTPQMETVVAPESQPLRVEGSEGVRPEFQAAPDLTLTPQVSKNLAGSNQPGKNTYRGPNEIFTFDARFLANANSPKKQMTPEQWLFYQQILYEYFTTMGMPELAANFTCNENNNEPRLASGQPSSTKPDSNTPTQPEGVTTVVGVPDDSSQPEN